MSLVYSCPAVSPNVLRLPRSDCFGVQLSLLVPGRTLGGSPVRSDLRISCSNAPPLDGYGVVIDHGDRDARSAEQVSVSLVTV